MAIRKTTFRRAISASPELVELHERQRGETGTVSELANECTETANAMLALQKIFELQSRNLEQMGRRQPAELLHPASNPSRQSARAVRKVADSLWTVEDAHASRTAQALRMEVAGVLESENARHIEELAQAAALRELAGNAAMMQWTLRTLQVYVSSWVLLSLFERRALAAYRGIGEIAREVKWQKKAWRDEAEGVDQQLGERVRATTEAELRSAFCPDPETFVARAFPTPRD